MNSENGYKSKKKETARSLYTTLLVLLMAIAVMVAIAGSFVKNISKSEPVKSEETTSGDVSIKEDSEDKNDAFGKKEESETDGKGTEEAATDTEDAVADSTDEPETKPAESVAAPVEALPAFTAPCSGAVSKAYTGSVPVFSATMEDWRTHGGVDLYAPAGTEVLAVADGRVTEVRDDAMMGTCVSIEHSGGALSIYKNLADELPRWIEVGASVKAGDVIATAGESALEEIADEGHLHFELKINGACVNPCDYITFGDREDYSE